MSKKLLAFILFLVSTTAFGQLIEKPLHKSGKDFKSRATEAKDTTLTLPFWDDFSTVETRPTPLLWKHGENVQVSATIGVNVPTFNVAVLNGVDSLGIPYDIDDTAISPVDSLVSQKIDLNQVAINNRNTVFMSFFWQANGLGEIPDAEDSLALCFLDAELNWVSQDINEDDLFSNALIGGPDVLKFDPNDPTKQVFTQVILPIPERFFHENFRFKFQSYGSKQGTFDSWLIDYVYINFDRNRNDVFYEDRAISMGVSAAFGGYSTIPFEHFFDNQATLSNTVNFEVNNLDDELQPMNFWVEIFDKKTDNSILQVNNESVISPIVNANERRTVTSNSIAGGDLLSDFDTTSLRFKTYIDSDDAPLIPNASSFYSFLSNDTIYNDLNLERHYAYDDGSAEFSAGINVDGGKIVVKYGILTRDTLTHIDINFPILFPDSERERIRILVLRDLTENQESMLISQEYSIPPRTSSDQFTRIPLREQYILEDTIYIGFEQTTNNFVAVGLDKNNDNGSKILFNLGEIWERNESVSGSLMIRPVFGMPFAPTANENEVNDELTIYPNPATNILNITGSYDSFSILDLSGKNIVVSKISNTQLDLSSLESGIYLISFLQNGTYSTKKFIKR